VSVHPHNLFLYLFEYENKLRPTFQNFEMIVDEISINIIFIYYKIYYSNKFILFE
jgi:hypothetical protein